MIERQVQLLGQSEPEPRVDLKSAIVTGTQEGLTDLSKYAVMGLVAGAIGWFILGKDGVRKFAGKVR